MSREQIKFPISSYVSKKCNSIANYCLKEEIGTGGGGLGFWGATGEVQPTSGYCLYDRCGRGRRPYKEQVSGRGRGGGGGYWRGSVHIWILSIR